MALPFTPHESYLPCHYLFFNLTSYISCVYVICEKKIDEIGKVHCPTSRKNSLELAKSSPMYTSYSSPRQSLQTLYAVPKGALSPLAGSHSAERLDILPAPPLYRCHELAFSCSFLLIFLNTYGHYPSGPILSTPLHSFHTILSAHSVHR